MTGISLGGLVNRIELILREDPSLSVELADLSEVTYKQLKILFETHNYDVRGIVNILMACPVDTNNKILEPQEKYILHISRRLVKDA